MVANMMVGLLVACVFCIAPSYQQVTIVSPAQDVSATIGGFAYFYAVFSDATLLAQYQYQWYKDDQAIAPGARATVSRQGNTIDLFLIPLIATDSGMYKLVVTLPNGQNLTTQAQLRFTGGTIVTQLQDQTVQEGSTVVLQIQLSEIRPSSDVRWYRNQQELTTGGRFSITNSGNLQTLTITNVQVADAGPFSAVYQTQTSGMLLTVTPTTTDVNECLLNTDNCAVNAVCTNTVGSFTCTCNAGYTGPGTVCNDINECTSNTNNCHPNAVCSNTIGSYTCACSQGYTGDGIICTDVNECLGVNNCDQNAQCTNTIGSYTCACRSGYTGNGFSCTPVQVGDVDECALNTDNCSPFATCTNTIGSFICTCINGYQGNGVVCTDRNECTTGLSNCGANSRCTNTPGSFLCSCNNGFSGNGIICSDIDECAQNTDNCDVNAGCTNTFGSFTCTCNAGFAGTGVTCSDVNECALNTDNCSPNAACRNTFGSFACTCNGGYVGDGVTCIDVNECTSGASNCNANARCTNFPGTFTCTCNSGFTGNGVVCTPVGDTDECALNLDNCDVNAVCTNLPGSFRCDCRNGYTGSGVTCSDVDECALNQDNCGANAVCTNTIGSFSCACLQGFSGNGLTCIDINECQVSNNCNQNAQCTNLAGSYRCACNAGFTGDGFTCTAQSTGGLQIIVPLVNVTTQPEGGQVVLYTLISELGRNGVWYKDGVPLQNSANVFTYISPDSQNIQEFNYLVIFTSTPADTGLYRFDVGGLTTQGFLTITPSGIVNGNWGAWIVDNEPDCGITCGSVTVIRNRRRECNNPAPSNGGITCPGSATDTQLKNCNFSPCPSTLAIIVPADSATPTVGASAVFQVQLNRENIFNGVWVKDNVQLVDSAKTQITTVGFTQRLVVNNVQVGDAGVYSYIVNGLTTNATLNVEGAGYGPWTAWSGQPCSATCGGVSRQEFRTRVCENEALSCAGETFESRSTICAPDACLVPVNGNWGEWSVSVDPNCGITCGAVFNVFRDRIRVCDSPPASNGGQPCPGSATDRQQKDCTFAPCPVVTQDLCSSVTRQSGVGYRYHPTDCDKYIQCYFNPNGDVVGVYRNCPFGYYWDQSSLRCDESWRVTCPLERCDAKCTSQFKMQGSCNGYWECDRGHAVAKCCPPAYMFVEGQGCRINFFCRDTCPTACAHRESCDKRQDWNNDEATYDVLVGLQGWMATQCISGSYFDVADCGCRPRDFTCRASYSVAFTTSTDLLRTWINTTDVAVSGGVGVFNSSSRFFANIVRPTTLPSPPVLLQFRYKETTTVSGRRVLLSMSQCSEENNHNGLEIAVDDEAITFEVRTTYGNVNKLSISTAGHSRYTWKTVKMLYNGFETIASIEMDNAKYHAHGYAFDSEILNCGLRLGTDGMLTTPHFIGEMNQMSVYFCDPGNVL